MASRTADAMLQTSTHPVKQLDMAGYSGRPLAEKLGIKPGMTVVTMNEPPNYRTLLGQAANGVNFSGRVRNGCDFIHFFTTRRSVTKATKEIAQPGCRYWNRLGIMAEKIGRRCDRCH